MTVAYVDTSALAKLVLEEPESEALRLALAQSRSVSSVLAAIELHALVRRRRLPALAATADAVLARMQQLPLSQAVVKAALSPRGLPTLRTLDLLHLLTARAARDELGATTLIAYDQELLDAARTEGFTVLAPA